MQNRIMKAVRTGTDTTFTFYVRDAQGNVLGVYNRTTAATPTITWAEQYIYGSGRLGSFHPGIAWTAASKYTGPHYATTRRLLQGQKRYELSNHLGNVPKAAGRQKDLVQLEKALKNEKLSFHSSNIFILTRSL